MRGANATLSYTSGSTSNSAAVRIIQTSYQYGVNSTESHSRQIRAFYPHRRTLGEFGLRIESLGYNEYKAFNNWLREYTSAVFEGQMGNSKGVIYMDVNMPSRKFHKVGILVKGIEDHDNTGSMVFDSQLGFMMLKDYNDSGTAITSLADVSLFVKPKNSANLTDQLAFYPSTVSSYKDIDNSIYNFQPEIPFQGSAAADHAIK